MKLHPQKNVLLPCVARYLLLCAHAITLSTVPYISLHSVHQDYQTQITETLLVITGSFNPLCAQHCTYCNHTVCNITPANATSQHHSCDVHSPQDFNLPVILTFKHSNLNSSNAAGNFEFLHDINSGSLSKIYLKKPSKF